MFGTAAAVATKVRPATIERTDIALLHLFRRSPHGVSYALKSVAMSRVPGQHSRAVARQKRSRLKGGSSALSGDRRDTLAERHANCDIPLWVPDTSSSSTNVESHRCSVTLLPYSRLQIPCSVASGISPRTSGRAGLLAPTEWQNEAKFGVFPVDFPVSRELRGCCPKSHLRGHHMVTAGRIKFGAVHGVGGNC